MKGSILDAKREEIELLFYENVTDEKIALRFNVSQSTVYSWRRKHGYIRKSLCENEEIPLTKDNLEVLVGTLLGDGNLSKDNKNARYSNGHGPKLKDYCEYITLQLTNLKAKTYYSKRHSVDTRTGIAYEKYECRTACNPALNFLYSKFYKTGKKVMPFDIIRKHFTAKSLAFLYMDDGNKTTHGYCIATLNFDVEEIKKFRKFLFTKFDLETSMFKDHRIYIKAVSAKHFTELIMPYIHDSMKYKLLSS